MGATSFVKVAMAAAGACAPVETLDTDEMAATAPNNARTLLMPASAADYSAALQAAALYFAPIVRGPKDGQNMNRAVIVLWGLLFAAQAPAPSSAPATYL